MADFHGFVQSIKRAAVDAVRAEAPAEVCFGTVTGVDPLEITIDQKLTLTEPFLALCRDVTDYTVEMTAAYETETAEGHRHEITGTKQFLVRNGLTLSDEVILMRMQGGQKFVVWDRVK